MGDDGLIDALTARFRVPSFIEGGDPISQLLWYKNPGGAAPSTGNEWPWESNILLTGGPDVYFEETLHVVCNPDCVEYSIIVTGELWNERIMLYYVENTPGAWSVPSNINSVVVDAAPGQPFEARFGDANNDGRLEVFASAFNQDKDNKTGNFWMYQQQDDGSWKRTALAAGFTAHPYLYGTRQEPSLLAQRRVQEHPNCLRASAQTLDRDIGRRRRGSLHHVPQVRGSRELGIRHSGHGGHRGNNCRYDGCGRPRWGRVHGDHLCWLYCRRGLRVHFQPKFLNFCDNVKVVPRSDVCFHNGIKYL